MAAGMSKMHQSGQTVADKGLTQQNAVFLKQPPTPVEKLSTTSRFSLPPEDVDTYNSVHT